MEKHRPWEVKWISRSGSKSMTWTHRKLCSTLWTPNTSSATHLIEQNWSKVITENHRLEDFFSLSQFSTENLYGKNIYFILTEEFTMMRTKETSGGQKTDFCGLAHLLFHPTYTLHCSTKHNEVHFSLSYYESLT